MRFPFTTEAISLVEKTKRDHDLYKVVVKDGLYNTMFEPKSNLFKETSRKKKVFGIVRSIEASSNG